MTQEEAIELIGGATFNKSAPRRWADLGCGAGLFSRALAALLPEGSSVYCFDKEAQRIHSDPLAGVTIEFQLLDFENNLPDVNQLDGIMMANSLHYIKDQQALLERLAGLLMPGGRFIIIEYDMERGNPWVPYPVSFEKLKRLMNSTSQVRRIGERESLYGRGMMYASEVLV